MTSGQEIERLLFAHIPEAFFKRSLEAVFAAHRLAFEECRAGYAETEAENLRPLMKRAKLEGYLRDAADLTTGVESRVLRAEGSNWWHTEVFAGPVILTESSVQTPAALVEKAEFRTTLARSGEQRLFALPGDEPPDDAPLYVLLLHSKSTWADREERLRGAHLPGSAYLGFPSPTLDYYVHEIDLFDKFPEVVDNNKPDDLSSDAFIRYLGRARKYGSA